MTQKKTKKAAKKNGIFSSIGRRIGKAKARIKKGVRRAKAISKSSAKASTQTVKPKQTLRERKALQRQFEKQIKVAESKRSKAIDYLREFYQESAATNAVDKAIREGRTTVAAIRARALQILDKPAPNPKKGIVSKIKRRIGKARARIKKGARVKNADHKDSQHPVEVKKHWRESPATFHQKVRRAGQQDLFAAGWTRNGKPKAKAKRAAKNPATPASVKRIRKDFAGNTTGQVTEWLTPPGSPADASELGRLVEIKIVGRKQLLKFNNNPAMLAAHSNGGRRRMLIGLKHNYAIKNPDQSDVVLGEVQHVVYRCAKPHLGYEKVVPFIHEMGEEGGKRPTLILTKDGLLQLRGGDYTIKREGIRN